MATNTDLVRAFQVVMPDDNSFCCRIVGLNSRWGCERRRSFMKLGIANVSILSKNDRMFSWNRESGGYFSHSSRQSFASLSFRCLLRYASVVYAWSHWGWDSIEPRGEDSIDVAVPDDDTGRARATRLPRANVRLLVLMWQSESVIKQDWPPFQ